MGTAEVGRGSRLFKTAMDQWQVIEAKRRCEAVELHLDVIGLISPRITEPESASVSPIVCF
jgi:hypothetical protein